MPHRVCLGSVRSKNENDSFMRPDDLQTTTWYFEQDQVDDLRPERLDGWISISEIDGQKFQELALCPGS